eukprot:scaffold189951_cov28-Tisochrysis_lutea.AAC.4
MRTARARCPPAPPGPSPLPLFIQWLRMIHNSIHTTTATNNGGSETMVSIGLNDSNNDSTYHSDKIGL